MVTFNIAIMGASQSGKTQLAHELSLATTADATAPMLCRFTDGPPLMAALLSQLLAPHAGVLQAALEAHQRFNLTLVCGLDLSPQQGPPSHAKQVAQEAQDAALRKVLTNAKLPFAVVYGLGRERLAAAQRALSSLYKTSVAPAQNQLNRWHAQCDNCSDPACERALFSELLRTPSY